MKTAEKILREYVEFADVNGSKAVKLLPLTIIDAMIEYAREACREQRILLVRALNYDECGQGDEGPFNEYANSPEPELK